MPNKSACFSPAPKEVLLALHTMVNQVALAYSRIGIYIQPPQKR